MKKILKFFLSSSYTQFFVPLVVATLTPIWISWSNQINFKQSIKLIVDFIKIKVITIFSYKIPIWIILSAVFILFLLKKLITFITDNSYPDWYSNFRKFEFKEWLFTWEYDQSFTIKKLTPICFCGCDLVKKSKIGNTYYGSPRLYCPNCKKIYNVPNSRDLEELNCIIIYKVKTNTYKKDFSY